MSTAPQGAERSGPLWLLRCPYCEWDQVLSEAVGSERALELHQEHARSHEVPWETFLSDLEASE